MILRELIPHLGKATVSGDLDADVQWVTMDSRSVKPGFVFVAIRGEALDGHTFIDEAIAQGAVAIVAERAPNAAEASQVAWVHSADSRCVLARAAAALVDFPSTQLKTVGVTGTNGKTTVSFLLHHIMKQSWIRAGLLGTVVVDDGEETKTASHTTPTADVLQSALQKMLHNGCRGVSMEVSSHGIEQQRVASVLFDAVIFTNLTQDHLDYHGTMENYFAAKASLFDGLARQEGQKKPRAVINLDDGYGEKLVKQLGERVSVITYGMGAHCDFKISKIRQSVRGTEFQLDNRGKSYLVRLPLIGRFNVYNATAAIAGASVVGIKIRDAVKVLAEAPQVPGRMEMVGSREGVTAFVDYAHTPDALVNACATLRDLEPKKLITVFGCGGDRDQSKRPLMAEAASKGSDLCFITSDNPRSEDPQAILKEIEAGMRSKAYRCIEDREEAIRTAVNIAGKHDVVLIAGKGHETYQQCADERKEFDDRKIARWALRDKPPIKDLQESKQKYEDKPVRKKRQPRELDGEKPEYQKPQKYGERRVGGGRRDASDNGFKRKPRNKEDERS